MNPTTPNQDPHLAQPVLQTGAPLDRARAAMILIHGRGASANDILLLANEFQNPDYAYLAPQAANHTWYPNRFMEPLSTNEPWLSSALAFVGRILTHVEQAGIPPERTILLGFSQGACLTLEYTARHAQRYGGIVGLSGGLIGPELEPARYTGTFAGTPIFLGCSDHDPHIPKERVTASGHLLQQLGATVTVRLYPHLGHEVNQDEINFIKTIMQL
ncbi:MAG TPA: phospholipase [Anaerolineae bacterium]|nr:phospholipase [Anaerolineae bacterium]